MKILKILNSSVVLATNEQNEEVIVMRKGIGYNNKVGNHFNENDLDKIYILQTKQSIVHLLSQTDDQILDVSLQIYDLANTTLSNELDKNLIIILTDHINFILKRKELGQIFQNKLFWEIKKYYSNEYSVALKSLKIINQKLNTNIDIEEASNIAFHIINAESHDYDVKYVESMTQLINDIINIIKFHYHINFNEDSLSYIRLISHIKFLVHRLLQGDKPMDNFDIFSFNKINTDYKDDLICINKISDYLEVSLNIHISKNEKMYLLIHINRLKEENQNA